MGCGGGHALDAYKRATLGRPDLIPGHQLGWPCIRLGNSHRHVVPRSTASMSETMPRRRQPAVMAAILHGHPDFTSKQVNPHLRRRPLLSYPAVLMSPPQPPTLLLLFGHGVSRRRRNFWSDCGQKPLWQKKKSFLAAIMKSRSRCFDLPCLSSERLQRRTRGITRSSI